MSQDDVGALARHTGDHQWIHVDRERAKEGPFGAPIARAYSTLALSTIFLDEVVTVVDAHLVLNYGRNRVRYPAPVPVESRVRAVVNLVEAHDVLGGTQAVYRLTYEVEALCVSGGQGPAAPVRAARVA